MVIKQQLLAEARRIGAMSRRYPLQTFGGMLTILVIFTALLTGARYIAGPLADNQNRDGALIVGLVLWNLLNLSVHEVSLGIQGEAQLGTLENLFLASRSLVKLMLLRALVGQLIFLVINIAILLVVASIVGVQVSLSTPLLIPVAAALLATNGIGLAFGALALLSKRVGSIVRLAQFTIVSVVVPPFETFLPKAMLPWFELLPLAAAARMVRSIMTQNQVPSGGDIIAVFVNGLVYFIGGIIIFELGEQAARKRGALAGH